MSRYLELKSQLEALDVEVEAARLAERADALAQCRELVDAFGLTAFELGLVKVQQLRPGRKPSPTFKAKLPRRTPPPTYRDPATGETWTGQGQEPAWIEGNRDEYLIGDAQAA